MTGFLASFIPRTSRLIIRICFPESCLRTNSEKLFIQAYIIRWVETETQILALFSVTLSSLHLIEEMKMLPGSISRVHIERKSVAKLVSREGLATTLVLPHCLSALL